MGIPDHLNCHLRNLYVVQEATVRTGHGTTDWFQIGKGVHQGCVLPTHLFNLYTEMPGWMKHKLESRLPAEISITSGMQMTPPLWHHKLRGTKKPVDESKKGELKSWLKTQHSENQDHGIQSHHFMANRWGNNGNSDRPPPPFFFLAPKSLQMVTAAMKLKDACSLEEKL